MRLVAFEGGGEALEALAGRHVQVVAGDVAEVAGLLEAGRPLRVLAVLAAQRLPGRWARVPTAREQGYDIRWPILRGLYVGAGVPDELVRRWQDLMLPALSTPASVAAREPLGLQASLVSGPALELLVARQMDEYRRMARDIGLPPLPAGR
ncbi:Bug family tripartite tricarboxylate transporter substrate binding protein [Sphaerotilus hippei]|nr:tripartite tricarboxylate transporter substrate-binding protein [Sphaerotilus hippei]